MKKAKQRTRQDALRHGLAVAVALAASTAALAQADKPAPSGGDRSLTLGVVELFANPMPR